LNQKVEETGKVSPNKLFDLLPTKAEKVFIRSNPKPLEMQTTFGKDMVNFNNTWATHLPEDKQKLKVFENFKQYNRNLTKAFNRQTENAEFFQKAKGSALPESQIK
jgi:hypothetical protein